MQSFNLISLCSTVSRRVHRAAITDVLNQNKKIVYTPRNPTFPYIKRGFQRCSLYGLVNMIDYVKYNNEITQKLFISLYDKRSLCNSLLPSTDITSQRRLRLGCICTKPNIRLVNIRNKHFKIECLAL